MKTTTLHTFHPIWKNKRFYIVDNCYDPYTRNKNLKFINDNQIKCIVSQDNDLSYLSECPDIEFVICSSESNHLETLYKLRKLKGLSLSTDDTDFDFSKLTASLSFLHTKYESHNKSWLNNTAISTLSLYDYETENLSWLSELRNKNKLELFEIDSYRKFRSLIGLKALSNIKVLILNYCRQLTDITEIYSLDSLQVLHFYDNPRVKQLDLHRLTTLTELYLIDWETLKPKTVDSLSFISSLPNLQTFWSNYNIKDGDLSLLLGLSDVEIFQDRSHYNIKRKNLPHKEK